MKERVLLFKLSLVLELILRVLPLPLLGAPRGLLRGRQKNCGWCLVAWWCLVAGGCLVAAGCWWLLVSGGCWWLSNGNGSSSIIIRSKDSSSCSSSSNGNGINSNGNGSNSIIICRSKRNCVYCGFY